MLLYTLDILTSVLHHFMQSQCKQGKDELLYTQLASKSSRILGKQVFSMPQQGSSGHNKSHHTIASKLQESRLKIDLINSYCLRLFSLYRDNRVEISDIARLVHQGFKLTTVYLFLKKFPFLYEQYLASKSPHRLCFSDNHLGEDKLLFSSS